MLRWLALLAALALAAGASGCYLSHERPGDAGAPVDAPADAGPARRDGGPCPEGERRIQVALRFGPGGTPNAGGLLVYDRSGGELYAGSTEHFEPFDVCVPAPPDEPLAISMLGASWGHNHVLGEIGDFLHQDAWCRGGYSTPPDRFTYPGRLVPQVPDSRFTVQLTMRDIATFSESPFEARCAGVLSACRLRFLEQGPDGALLGGDAFDFVLGEIVLDTHASTVGAGRFVVERPTTGLLAGLPLEVRALDCRDGAWSEGGGPGPAEAGELDLWQCAYAGIGTIEDETPDGATGIFQYVSGGGNLAADTLVAHLGSAEEGLEAYAMAPCCGSEEPIRLHFDEVRTLEGGGPSRSELWFTVDAPGYGHAFAESIPVYGIDDRLWMFQDDGQADVTPEVLPEVYREGTEDPTEPMRDIWVGAVDTGEHGPWEGTRPLHMVRRRVFHL